MNGTTLMPKLAVILPVYKNDRLEYLRQSIESLLQQTFKDFIIKIFIDGPIDSQIRDYLNSIKSKTLFVFYFDKNYGLPFVLNSGIELCIKEQFEFIARMDADDISHKDRFMKQIEYLDKYKSVMALGTEAFIVDSKGDTVGRKKVVKELTLQVLKKTSDIIHPSVVFRTEFFKQIGMYDEKLIQAQDYDLWFRAVNQNLRVESLNECLYNLRYDDKLVYRRKKAQKYVLKSKRKYLKKQDYLYLIPQILIIFTPSFLLKSILFNKVRKDLKT